MVTLGIAGVVPLIHMCLLQVLLVAGKLPCVVGFSAGCCAFNQDVPCTSCSRETALCSRVLCWVMELIIFLLYLQKLDCKSHNYCTWFNNNLQVCVTYQQIHYASQCVEPMFLHRTRETLMAIQIILRRWFCFIWLWSVPWQTGHFLRSDLFSSLYEIHI